ncbi:MAG: BatD family protein [bacterium]
MKTTHIFLAAICLAAVAEAQAANPVSVHAVLDPPQIALGEESRLKLVINAPSDAENICVPRVQGLELTYIGAGRSSRMSIVNGVTSSESSFTHSYSVTALQTGEFTIPMFIVRVDGKLYQSDPMTLRVLSSSAQAAAPLLSSVPSATAPAKVDSRLAFVQLIIPKEKLYVGEKTLIQVKAYFLAGQRATYAPPSVDTDAFAVSDFNEQPSKTQETVQGSSYTVLTWNSALTAIKAGRYPVDVKLNCVVLLNRRRSGLLDDSNSLFFNDPFFHRPSLLSSFFSNVEQRELQLTSQQQWVEAAPLPEVGKPAQFSGAVGHFQIQTSARPTQVNLGDPVTLKIIVQGKGNFDRVTTVDAISSEGWKTYPPRAKFSPTDAVGYEGSKVLEQVFAPQKADLKTLPQIQLTYFDPETGRYETISASPIPISVTMASGVQPLPEATASSIAPSSPPSSVAPPQPEEPSSLKQTPPKEESRVVDFAPNKINLGRLEPTLKPIAWNNWFLAVQGGLLLALVVLSLAAGRQQGRANDPDHVRLSTANKNIKTQLELMAQAKDRNDAVAFFAAARRALQERLGEKWKMEPTVITIADVNERMETHHPTNAIFAMADSVVYAGKAGSDVSLEGWEDTVLKELKRLENES